MEPATPRPPLIAWVMLITLGMIWGGSFMATRIATTDLGPFTLAAARIWIGALTLVGWLAITGPGLPRLNAAGRRFWVFAVAVGFLSNAMPFVALSWGQSHIPSGLAGVYMASVPFFVLPLGHVFVPGERMTVRRTVGLAVGFCGVLVLILPSIAAVGDGAVVVLAQLACLLTAFGYASGGIVSKRAPQMGLLRFAAAALLAAAVMVTPVAFLVEDPLGAVPAGASALAVLYLGVVPTGIAMVMLLAVIARTGPGFLSLVNYQVPVWAVLFGVAFLGEAAPGRLWVALGLILLGLAISQNLLGLRRGGHARG